MKVESDRHKEAQSSAARVLRSLPRLVLLILAALIVVFLAWTFLGGGSVSFRPGGQTPGVTPSEPQPAEKSPDAT